MEGELRTNLRISVLGQVALPQNQTQTCPFSQRIVPQIVGPPAQTPTSSSLTRESAPPPSSCVFEGFLNRELRDCLPWGK